MELARAEEKGSTLNRIEQVAVDTVGLLGGLVRRLRLPLLLLVLVPAVPAAVVLLLALITHNTAAAVLALIGLIPAGWLALRRGQLLGALQPPETAVAELRATFSAGDIADQLRKNLLTIRDRKRGLIRGLPGTLWRGIRTGTTTWSRLTDVPRLAPFLPGRLRGLAVLTIACLVSGVVLTGVALLLLLGIDLV